MVLKKGLDYNLVVPQTWTMDWVLEFNDNIAEADFIGTCIKVGAYDAAGVMLPGAVQ